MNTETDIVKIFCSLKEQYKEFMKHMENYNNILQQKSDNIMNAPDDTDY